MVLRYDTKCKRAQAGTTQLAASDESLSRFDFPPPLQIWTRSLGLTVLIDSLEFQGVAHRRARVQPLRRQHLGLRFFLAKVREIHVARGDLTLRPPLRRLHGQSWTARLKAKWGISCDSLNQRKCDVSLGESAKHSGRPAVMWIVACHSALE